MQNIEIQCGNVSLNDEGILRITLTESVEIDEIGAKYFIEAINSLTDKSPPLLIDGNSHSLSLEAKCILANANNICAVAMLILKPHQKHAVTYFIESAKPIYPMKFFYTENNAIAWLKDFL